MARRPIRIQITGDQVLEAAYDLASARLKAVAPGRAALRYLLAAEIAAQHGVTPESLLVFIEAEATPGQ